MPWTGIGAAAVMGGGSLIGGLFGSKSASSINRMQMKLARDQFNFQQDYAKSRLQWQVDDAKKAGLHPMVAAGLSPTSFSPVSPNLTAPDYSWIGDMAQNVDYAATKAKTQKQQAQAYNFMVQSQDEQIKGLKLDNMLKQMEILSMGARLKNAGPAAPTSNAAPGLIGGQDGSVKIVPDEIIAPDPSNPSSTAGTHPLFTHARIGDFTMPVLSDKLADAVTENKEKNIAAELNYALGAWKGSLKRPLSSYTQEEKLKLASGDYTENYYPLMGWRVEPKVSFRNFLKFIRGDFKKRYYNGGGGADWR